MLEESRPVRSCQTAPLRLEMVDTWRVQTMFVVANRFVAEFRLGAVAHTHIAVVVAPRSGSQGKPPV